MARRGRKEWRPGGTTPMHGPLPRQDGRLEEIIEGHYYATRPEWIAGVAAGGEEDIQVQLAIYVEIMDMLEATGDEEYENYPYVVEASIVLAYPGPQTIEEGQVEGETPLHDLLGVYGYFGGIPITHHLADVEIPGRERFRFDAEDAMWVTSKPQFGTIAAQRGPGTEFRHPRFADEDAALRYANELLEAAPAIMMMVGFTLDQPINMAGDDGWSSLERQLK